MAVTFTGPESKRRTFRLLVARLRRVGALSFVYRYLKEIVVEERSDIYANVTRQSAHFPLAEFTDDTYTASAIIHETAHIMLYQLGQRYYGRYGEAAAYLVAYAFAPWILPPPVMEITENDPVHGNPVVPVKGTANV